MKKDEFVVNAKPKPEKEQKKDEFDPVSDVIELPVGKALKPFTLSNLRKNPWILSTIILLIVLIVLLFSKSSPISGTTVSEQVAGQNLINFINSQGKGDASLVSTKQDGSLYQVTVKYQGQDVPVFVTLDGKYLISDTIPLSDTANTGNQNNNPNNAPNQVQIDPEKIKDAPSEGNKDAKVTIIEFTDYQCPFCGKHFTDTYPQIKKDYIDTGKTRYVLMNFPLNSIHPNAEKAAESALCVKEQKGDSGYWKMHDKLFSNQESLSVENEKKWARELGVDGTKFDTCLDSGKYAQRVQEEESYGQSLGVSGTPAFFINGNLIEGAVP